VEVDDRRGRDDARGVESRTLHPTPYTLHPTPYTLHPSPFTLHVGFITCRRRWSSNPSGKYSYERPTRGTVYGTMRSMCGADAGGSATNHQSLSSKPVEVDDGRGRYDARGVEPCTLHPTPFTLHPSHYTVHTTRRVHTTP
jgi:hypothetical protein